MQDLKDITIIGAGPTGLFGCFYAGMRGASCRVIDNLDQAGGQLTALYPEKYIFDVAGFPKVLAKDLVKGMAEQALQLDRKSTRLNSSHLVISYAVFCLKKKKTHGMWLI